MLAALSLDVLCLLLFAFAQVVAAAAVRPSAAVHRIQHDIRQPPPPPLPNIVMPQTPSFELLVCLPLPLRSSVALQQDQCPRQQPMQSLSHMAQVLNPLLPHTPFASFAAPRNSSLQKQLMSAVLHAPFPLCIPSSSELHPFGAHTTAPPCPCLGS